MDSITMEIVIHQVKNRACWCAFIARAQAMGMLGFAWEYNKKLGLTPCSTS